MPFSLLHGINLGIPFIKNTMKENRDTTQNDREDLLREGRKEESVNTAFDQKQNNEPLNSLEEKAKTEQEYKEALTERD